MEKCIMISTLHQILSVIESRKMIGEEHATCLRNMTYAKNTGWETNIKPKHLEDLNVDERIILKWIPRKKDGRV
jgi:hypothetical protein